MRNNIGILLFFLFVISCTERHTYMHMYQSISDEGLCADDSLIFQIPTQKVDTIYNLQLEVRHNVDINYECIYMSVAYLKLDSCISLLANDTIRIQLMDENGYWLGKGIGRLYQTDISLQPFIVEKDNSYCVKIKHLHQDSMLIGIDDIGLRLY